MKDKRNILLYIIIVLLIFIIVFLCLLLLKVNTNNTSKIENNPENVVDSPEVGKVDVGYTEDEFLNNLSGIWKYVDSNGTNYAIRITSDKGFSYGQYGTDGGIYGNISKFGYLGNKVYSLTVFSPGCHGDGCLDEMDDASYNIMIDLSYIESKKIGFNINMGASNNFNYYEYVAKTWEEAENYFSY